MFDALSLWVKQIITVVIFATFVDFLIPENKYFRYIKVFLGLLVMMAIVNPIVPLLHKDISFNEISSGYKDFVDKATIKHESETLNKSNNELTIDKYKRQVEKYLTDKITDMTFYDVKSVNIKINEEYSGEDFGKITQLLIMLGKKQTNTNKSEEKISIETIKLKCDETELNILDHNKHDEFQDIIRYLHTTFNIPEENIYIDLED